ncbi:MAG: DUF4417 domain-containing protein [Eggerthellaceae bacterium]|nr:DUF4417 domain-containing protein [Eggerthellaceae bacterium]
MKEQPELSVHEVPTGSLLPYANNAKLHSQLQVEQIANSIEEFGFNDPIAVWENGRGELEVVEGHGRVLAAQKLGIDLVPVIYLNHLSDEARRAYTHVHNQTTLNSGFDFDVLDREIAELDFDWRDVGFEVPEIAEAPDVKVDRPYGAEMLRSDREWNLLLCSREDCAGEWELPTLDPVDADPPDLIGFNYCKSARDFSPGVHFCIDDYQFERVWRNPGGYLETLRMFDCVVCPDFSVYTDMPYPMKLWNIYRSRALGHWWQSEGLTVVPNVTWSDESSFPYCFDGIPKGGTIFISTVGVTRDKNARRLALIGMEEALSRIGPSRLLLYGSDLGYDFGGLEVRRYEARRFGRDD